MGMNKEDADETSRQIAAYLKDGKLSTIHSKEPNLETVFMELTGRKLEV